MLTGLFKRQWSSWRMTMPALKKRRQSFWISELKDQRTEAAADAAIAASDADAAKKRTKAKHCVLKCKSMLCSSDTSPQLPSKH